MGVAIFARGRTFTGLSEFDARPRRLATLKLNVGRQY